MAPPISWINWSGLIEAIRGARERNNLCCPSDHLLSTDLSVGLLEGTNLSCHCRDPARGTGFRICLGISYSSQRLAAESV
jgi:hypothetical protein